MRVLEYEDIRYKGFWGFGYEVLKVVKYRICY